MINMNYENLLKKAKENTIKTRTIAKLNIEVFEVGQKVRVSNCISILNDSIFENFQPLNKYSKCVKRKCGLSKDELYTKGWIIVK